MSRNSFIRAFRGDRIARALISLTLAATAAGCPRVQPEQSGKSDDGLDQLSGTWRGSNAGLTVFLTLRQTGDSLSGTGNFQVERDSSIGCGGETLSAAGALTLSGQLVGREYQGRMNFADSWTPPYVGTLVPPDTLNGHFMSVDRGGCPLVLVRQR